MKLHHIKSGVCTTRAPYREGRFPKGVKVYTVNQESQYLLVQGVPAVGAHTELVKLFALYGTVLEYRLLDEYASEAFTEVIWIQFKRIQESRIAKRKLDDYSFFGNTLHVAYAPEYESVDDTREKLKDRRKIIASHIRRLDEEKCATLEGNATGLSPPVYKSHVVSAQEPMIEDLSNSSFQQNSEMNGFLSSLPTPPTLLPPRELSHREIDGSDHLKNSFLIENSMPREIPPQVMLSSNMFSMRNVRNDVGKTRQLHHLPRHCQNPAHEPSRNNQPISSIQAVGMERVKHSQPCATLSAQGHNYTVDHHLNWIRDNRDDQTVALTKTNTEQFSTGLYPRFSKNHDFVVSKLPKHASTSSDLPFGDIVLRDYKTTRVAAKFIPRQISKRKYLPKEILIQASKTQNEKAAMKQTIKDSVSEELRRNAIILGNTEGPKQPENLKKY